MSPTVNIPATPNTIGVIDRKPPAAAHTADSPIRFCGWVIMLPWLPSGAIIFLGRTAQRIGEIPTNGLAPIVGVAPESGGWRSLSAGRGWFPTSTP
jgi:hypothetical protein